jgi:CubicO group peptidase (beta-lactamase class C family)
VPLFLRLRRGRLAASALALALAPVLAAGPLAAQDRAPDVARMDQIVRASSEADAFSGAVLVARDGEILLDRGYGLANREWGVPNDGDVKFRLGSLSKQFTAVAVLLLSEQGKVDLDAPIKTWLPDAPAAWDAVTADRPVQRAAPGLRAGRRLRLFQLGLYPVERGDRGGQRPDLRRLHSTGPVHPARHGRQRL